MTILGDRLLALYDEIQKVFTILEDIKSTSILSPPTPKLNEKENENLRTSSYIEIHENAK